MVRHATLNNVEHRDLRVRTDYSAEFGDNLMCTLAIPSEFHALQAEYPIFLHHDEATGQLLPMVMFGFEEGENLYLDNGRWRADYIPLMIRRGPFLIGLQRGDAAADRKMVVSIDLDSPRVGAEGEALFQPFGDQSEYLENVVEVLQQIDQGQAAIAGFTAALQEHELIEPFALDLTLNNGRKHRLTGFHAIHQERLAGLDGPVLADFSRRGILMCAYMLVASMARIPRLIALRNEREARATQERPQ